MGTGAGLQLGQASTGTGLQLGQAGTGTGLQLGQAGNRYWPAVRANGNRSWPAVRANGNRNWPTVGASRNRNWPTVGAKRETGAGLQLGQNGKQETGLQLGQAGTGAGTGLQLGTGWNWNWTARNPSTRPRNQARITATRGLHLRAWTGLTGLQNRTRPVNQVQSLEHKQQGFSWGQAQQNWSGWTDEHKYGIWF